jgi:eukaryotic-like serine/threonine-protein kinase
VAAEQHLLNQRYRLLGPLGAGGMAVIYKAQDLALGRLVAVKILREPLMADPDFLARFQQEARAAANLAHPNIVTVHDFGRDGGRNYIIMEYIEGQDLKTLIKDSAPLKVDRALDIAIQICAGIGYAHRAGLVHCDVKPQNILVTPDGRVKVADFGIARALANLQPGETTDVVWGSPQYYSPEQAAGEVPTPASDVYSIGIVMYEMLAGRLPFVAQTQQALAMMHLRDEPPRLTSLNAALPESLERIVHKVLAKEPSARYRTADQLGRILISYRERGDSLTGPQPAAPRTATIAPRGAYAPPASPPEADGAVPPPPAAPTVAHGQVYGPASTHPRAPEPAGQVLPNAPTVYRQPVATPLPHRVGPRGEPFYDPYPEPEGLDWVGMILGFLAFIAVAGLIPFWAYIWSVYR